MFSLRLPVAALGVMSFAAVASARSFDGCYSSPGSLTFKKNDMYMTFDVCQAACGSSKVMGLFNGGDCYCGDEIPADSAKAATSDCSTVCNGYGADKCGGPSAYSVLTINGTPNVAGGDSSASSAAPTATGGTTPTPVATSGPAKTPNIVSSVVIISSAGNRVTQTVVQTIAAPAQTQPSSPSPSASSQPSGGISSGAIAAAVVVSVLGAAGLIAAIIFFMKWKKGREEMSHHRRIQSTNAFGAPQASPIRASTPPWSSDETATAPSSPTTKTTVDESSKSPTPTTDEIAVTLDPSNAAGQNI